MTSQRFAASAKTLPREAASLQRRLPLLAGAFAVSLALVWAVSAGAASTPIDAAEHEVDAMDAANAAEAADEADIEHPMAVGDEDAITKAVREAPRTEEGGHDLYRKGLYPEALMVWEEAADAGDAGAAYRIGAAYMDGQSVSHSFEKGFFWLNRSAEMGDGRAMGDLGSAYDWGFGVDQDRAVAAQWYEKAALRGHAASQYNVGVLYEEGDGVEQDLVKAYMYYILANENGFPKYPAEAMEKLTPKLTNNQIKQGVDAARAFEPL